MNILVTDHDGRVLIEDKAEADEPLALDTVRLFWIGREYEFRDIAVWWTVVDPDSQLDGVTGDALARVATTMDLAKVYVTWTDDTNTDPRYAGRPADVKHTLEWAIPGGGMGPFLVTVG